MDSLSSSPRLLTAARLTGLAYILLMMLHVPLAGPFFCEDLLAPLFLAMLVVLGPRQAFSGTSSRWLAAFLLLTGAVTLFHTACGGTEDAYNTAVLVYLAGVFLAFRHLDCPASWRLALGGGFLLAATACWLAEPLRAVFPEWPGQSFWLVTDNARDSAMAFLTKRYQFTFSNPNSLGSFYALPMALALTALSEVFPHWSRRRRMLCLILLGMSFLPLCHTFSKHAIMSGALFLGFLCSIAPAGRWLDRLKRLSWLPVVLLGLLCLVTVLWTTFPLTSHAPFINTVPGGYTIHQDTYARMALESPKTFLTGRTLQNIRHAYPAAVDRPRADRILSQYNAQHLLDSFCTFMDPHNEYLNLITFYGIGAVLLALAFFMACIRERPDSPLLILAIIALAFCCLWDDLLSKRWIWVMTASLLASRQSQSTDSSPHDQSRIP